MRIDIITVLPEMIEGFVKESILARAQKKGLAEIHLHNLRDYTLDKWRRVDDYPYGGFAGMVMQCEPIDRCISALKAERDYDHVIFTTPDGEQFNQKMANDLSRWQENIIILCGHYKGIDYRIREHLITKRDQHRRLCADGRRTCGGRHHCRRRGQSGARRDRRRPERALRLRFRTTSWLRPSTPDRPTTRAGRCPTSCSAATRPRSNSGRWIRPSPAPSSCAPTC
jgi:hypothetical protein